MDLEHFINPGYGWLCKHCRPLEDERADQSEGRARFFNEGESEEKRPDLSTPALARWRDTTRTVLVCPGCGIEELVQKT